MSLFQELKRRNVFRVGIAYLLVAWVVLQAADFVLEVIDAPGWVLQVFVLAAALGLIAAIIFSWVFELTPEGIKREDEIDRDASITRSTGKRLDRVIIGFLLIAVVVLGWDNVFTPEPGKERATEPVASEATDRGEPAGPTAADTAAQSIAVLPFVNMSPDAENEFFSDGVSEEILNVLARVPELKVAARTSAFSFKGTNQPVGQIADALGVNHVLEGSVRKAGNRVRVTAQLIKADDGFHLWSETYDRELDDIFAIQDEIATQIADALKVTLELTSGASGNLTGTNSIEAYELYLRGISLWHERSAVSLDAALEAFERATEIDPDFDKAWGGLALTWTVYHGYVNHDPNDSTGRAIDAADRALALAPDNAEALAAKANSLMTRGDHAQAEALYEQAIALSPSLATAFQWYGRLKQYQGDHAQAQRLMERAVSLDPQSRIMRHNLAWAYMLDERMADGARMIEALMLQYPDFPDGLSMQLVFQLIERDCARAEQTATRLVALFNKDPALVQRYLTLCETTDAQTRHDLIVELLGEGGVKVANPDSPQLLYDIEFWFLATHFENNEAAAHVISVMPRSWSPSELGFIRNDRRPGARRFNCSETAQSLYRSLNVPPPTIDLACDEFR